MSEVGIRTTPTQSPHPPKEAPAPGPKGGGGRRPTSPALLFFKALASLRLTVVLFVLSMLLVFFGTMAQMDQGLFTVLHSFFRCFLAWIPLQVFLRFGQVFFGLPSTWEVSGSFPFPGGYTIGVFLLINLIAAHTLRFRPFRRVRTRPEPGAEGEPRSLGLGSGKLKFEWKKSGILLIHSGLIIMLLGEAVTGFFAVEATMTLAEGEGVNFVDVSNSVELAVTDPSDSEVNKVVTFSDAMLREGKVLSHEALPFDIQVQERWDNSNLLAVRGMHGVESTEDVFFTTKGAPWRVTPQGEERGVDASREDAVSARLVFRPKEGEGEPETRLLSMWFYMNYTRRSLTFPPQYVTVGGKAYKVELRPERVYKPYTVHLIKFTHDTFQGTSTPKDFASDVRVVDPEEKEDRTVHIWMNHPLFYRGETFYQAGYLPTDAGAPRGTVLQVVRNPGWVMPYLSCVMVALGMIVHFGTNLKKFQERRAAS